jgi:lactoylglutathione lyase
MKFNPLVIAACCLAMGSPLAAQVAPSGQITARVDHLALNVADAEASQAFYQEVFGFQFITAGGTTRWLDLGGFQLHLVGGRVDPVQTPKAVHFAISVDDLNAAAERLSARGHVWGDYPGQPGVIYTGRSDGVRQIFVQDPDGYWIEVNDRRLAP